MRVEMARCGFQFYSLNPSRNISSATSRVIMRFRDRSRMMAAFFSGVASFSSSMTNWARCWTGRFSTRRSCGVTPRFSAIIKSSTRAASLGSSLALPLSETKTSFCGLPLFCFRNSSAVRNRASCLSAESRSRLCILSSNAVLSV